MAPMCRCLTPPIWSVWPCRIRPTSSPPPRKSVTAEAVRDKGKKMPIEITMPALSPTMTEGNLARWLKREGDAVKAGDVLAEIETDKATMEVESIDDGTLGKIIVADGTEGVKVGALIALLLEEGESGSALAAPAPAKPAPAAGTPAAP